MSLRILGRAICGVAALVALGQDAGRVVQAVSTTLVIYEFRTQGPSGDFDEFIELRNLSGGPVDLAGWSVLGSTGAGAQEVLTTLPAVSLGPGCSWLIARSPGGYAGPLDSPYLSSIPDDGGIALRSPASTIVDAVGMSAGTAFGEGTRLAPLASNTDRSYERVGADTDNNRADFVQRSPSTPTTFASGVCFLSPPSISGQATPNAVGPGDDTRLTAVPQPGNSPPSTGLTVAVDLSSTGGAASMPLLDDGASGDVVPGDGVFSRTVNVAPGTPPGVRSLPLTVTDLEGRTGTGTIGLTVLSAGPSTPPTATYDGDTFVLFTGVWIRVTVARGTNPTSTGLRVEMDLSPIGGSPTTVLSDEGGGACDYRADDLSFSACLMLPASLQPGRVSFTGAVTDAQGRSSPITTRGPNSFDVLVGPDADFDGMSNYWEGLFGLDQFSASGINGASGDPDGDGVTNLQEMLARTHPRGFFTRYLAEGVTNAFFRTRIALFDLPGPPSPESVRTLVRVQPQGAPERAFLSFGSPGRRRTVMPEDTAVLTGAPFATVIESDREVVVDRTVVWGDGDYGSHTETALFAPATTWTFAEGATGWRFDLFYLLQNPASRDASVEVTYLRGPSDPVLTRVYSVPARQRLTIWVDEEQFPAGSGTKPLAATDVSARIAVLNGVPIVAERAMYMSPDGQPFGAGHGAAGIRAPATTWFFAEGSTGDFFDEYLLIANAGSTPAAVTVTFTPEGAAPVSRNYAVAPNSRFTIWVDLIPGLGATALSATVISDVPIVAERAMWWPGSGESWREAHASVGATASGSRWAVADLEVGAPNDAHAFVLIHGGGSATVYFDDETAPAACGSSTGGRFTLYVNGCPRVAGRRFVSVIVDGNAGTVVERAIYHHSAGQVFGAGGAALGTRIP